MTAIKDIADRSCIPGKPVGILTGNERDIWAKDHSLLLGLFQFTFILQLCNKLHLSVYNFVYNYHLLFYIFSELGNNKSIIKDIETSLFILCLDTNIPKDAFKEKNNASVRAVQAMTGFNSCLNAGNRWHDKTVQVKYL